MTQAPPTDRSLLSPVQRLHEETSASSGWSQLDGAVLALGDVLSPAAAVLLAQRVDGDRDR